MSQPKKLPLFVVGSTGRMGKALLEMIADDSGFQLAGASSGRNAKELNAIEKLPRGSVVVDFSSPAVALEVSKRCKKSGAALLECSTGFTDAETTDLKKNLKGVTWALTPNTSLGVFVMTEIAKLLGETLPEEYRFSLWEAHHAAKKDAPSGTAKLLKSQIEKVAGTGRVDALHSVRGGTEVGHHRLGILGPFESLNIEHHAQDRKLFAAGALKLARLLSTCEPRGEAYAPADLWKKLRK